MGVHLNEGKSTKKKRGRVFLHAPRLNGWKSFYLIVINTYAARVVNLAEGIARIFKLYNIILQRFEACRRDCLTLLKAPRRKAAFI